MSATSTSLHGEVLRQRLTQFYKKSMDFMFNAVFQLRVLEKPYAGIMHKLIFIGVTLELVGTALNLMQMQLFVPFVELGYPRGQAYLIFELVMDLAGVAILVGVALALFRRLVLRPKSLESHWDDYLALVVLALIPIFGFLLEATRLLAVNPAWRAWSPAGNQLAIFLQSLGVTPATAASAHTFLFWSHAALGLLLFALIPFTKLRHLVFTPLYIWLRPQRKLGSLELIEDLEGAETLGVGKINEFKSQQLLALDACVRCGRCEEQCPVALAGMPFSPRTFIQSLRGAMVNDLYQSGGNPQAELLGGALPVESPWYCTTCGACLAHCPALINPVDEVIDLRRYQSLTTGKIPKAIADYARNMERQGNPWGLPAQERASWLAEQGVRTLSPGESTDVLLFLGCSFAYDERSQKAGVALVQLLRRAGVDFATLGADEACCGETLRRVGNEYLFQTMAQQNIDTLNQVHFKRIVTQCPHCFNTLKNEYPQLGGNYEVQHYTQYLLSLPLGGVAPNGNGIQERVSYHDSCYLGRYNQIYREPRQLLKQAGIKPVEMDRHGASSFCCGGGGGQMWQESDPGARINQVRLDQAVAAKAEIVATACPFCLLMFDDAIRSKGLSEQVKVMDIAEVIESQYKAGENSLLPEKAVAG